jgi:peptidoglycan/LPS O-acetylase OafA/YrhL
MQKMTLPYYPNLTSLRGIAALAVLLLHAWQFLGGPLDQSFMARLGFPMHVIPANGFLGVDLFFVLSGFLLSLPFLTAIKNAEHRPSLRVFFLRRVKRVVPAFWAQLLILGVIAWTTSTSADIKTYLVTAVFLQHLIEVAQAPNPVYWTLPIEWWFYFTLPVIVWFFSRAHWLWLLMFVLIGVIAFRYQCYEWSLLGTSDGVDKYSSIVLLRARYDQFFFGILAAWFHLKTKSNSPVRMICFFVGFFSLLAQFPYMAMRGDLFSQFMFPDLLFHFSVVALPLAMIVFSAAGNNRFIDALLNRKIFLALGAISYSLYLWHYPVLEATRSLGVAQWIGTKASVACAVIASLIIAFVSYRFIELPFYSKLAFKPKN